MSVDLKYDVLCLLVFVYGIPVRVGRSNGLNFVLVGGNAYIESTTVLSDNNNISRFSFLSDFSTLHKQIHQSEVIFLKYLLLALLTRLGLSAKCFDPTTRRSLTKRILKQIGSGHT